MIGRISSGHLEEHQLTIKCIVQLAIQYSGYCMYQESVIKLSWLWRSLGVYRGFLQLLELPQCYCIGAVVISH